MVSNEVGQLEWFRRLGVSKNQLLRSLNKPLIPYGLSLIIINVNHKHIQHKRKGNNVKAIALSLISLFTIGTGTVLGYQTDTDPGTGYERYEDGSIQYARIGGWYISYDPDLDGIYICQWMNDQGEEVDTFDQFTSTTCSKVDRGGEVDPQ